MSTKNDFDEINLIDYVNVIFKRRRMILRNTVLAAVAVAVVSLFLPTYYTATTTLLPPEDSDKGGLKGLLANAPGALLDISGVSTSSSEIFLEILRSRTVAEGVLSRKYEVGDSDKSLFEIWGTPLKTDAISRLHKAASMSANEQGIIQISIEMRDPNLAAQVARAFVAELDRVNQAKSFSRAKNSRLYIEAQLAKTQESLNNAGSVMADFQSKYRAVNLEEQTRVGIEKAGQIKGTIMAKEVELEVSLQTMKRDNPMMVRLQKELDELKLQFEHLQFGNSVPFEEQRDYFIPFVKVPEVGLKYAKLIREVKVQETVWQLLNQQYYSAKIQEARDTPTVQILDAAVPPERKSKPRRSMLVLLAASLMFAGSVFATFVIEFTEQVKNNEEEFSTARQIMLDLQHDYVAARAWMNKQFNRFRKST